MFEHKAAYHDLGRLVYGLAGIALGIIGLVYRDFAAVWQPLENLGAASHRAVIAVVFAAALLCAGTATLWRRTAGLAIASGVQAALASRLLTVMMAGFGVLVWAPMVIAVPSHFNWSGNAINLALAGAAWVVADSIASRRKSPLVTATPCLAQR